MKKYLKKLVAVVVAVIILCVSLPLVDIASATLEINVAQFRLKGDYHHDYKWINPEKKLIAYRRGFFDDDECITEEATSLTEFFSEFSKEEWPTELVVNGDNDGRVIDFASMWFKKITITGTADTVYSSAFSNNTQLTELIIEDGVERIDDNAFWGCTSLTNVYIPGTVKFYNRNGNPFRGCVNIINVNLDTNSPYYFKNNCIIEKESKMVVAGFRNCSIPTNNEVLIIGPAAFVNLEGETFIIPEGVKEISNNAFWGATFKNIIIPESVCKIGYQAFAHCDNLTSLVIPKNVSELYEDVIWGCDNFKEITVLNPKMNILEAVDDEHFYVYTHRNTTFKGYKNSTIEEYAKSCKYTFSPLNEDNYNNYYSYTGKTTIVTRDTKGLNLSGCTVTVNNQSYIMDSHILNIDIPTDYKGDITISKAGYITSSLQAEYISKYIFFTMYPDTETMPVIQHYLARPANSGSTGYNDLLRYQEYIYDYEGQKHDIYINVNPNGHSIQSIYLEQGTERIVLQNNTMNLNLNTGGLFNSENGEIKLCILTANGTVYKYNSRIVACKERLSLDASIGDSIDGVITEEMESLGGWEYKGKFKLGSVPISITREKNKVKGAIGVKGSDSSTATWYEAIKQTITKHERDGKNEYTKSEMESLEQKLQDSGGDIVEGYSQFGIDVNASIMGYIEGTWNTETLQIENVEIGMILKIEGEASYTQQSSVIVVSVPIPYYWTTKLAVALSTKLNGNISYENKKPEFSMEMPELTVGIDVSGSLCLGLNKIIGGGGKVSGGVNITFNAPDYDFSSSVWELEIDVGVTGQIAGLGSHDFTFWNGKHQIYPSEEVSNLSTKDLMLSYAENSVLLSSAYALQESEYSTHSNESIYTFKSNGYTYSSPKVANLSNGKSVMVWVDYDHSRRDINQTALFYSVYDPSINSWTVPVQVENDGTPDDFPVLKTINDKIYLVWNDAQKELSDDANLLDMLASMGVSYAEFNGTTFTSISSITNSNNYMDIAPDIAVISGVPTVLWLKNENNNIFGQSGINSLMIATKNDSTWNVSSVVNTEQAINSFVIVEEDKLPAVYYSVNVNNDVNSFDGYEIFKNINGTSIRLTDNDYSDINLTSYENRAFWTGKDKIYDINGSVSSEGINYNYIVIADDNGKYSIIYAVTDSDGQTSYNICKETEYGWGKPVVLAKGAFSSGGISAYWQGNSLVMVANEYNDTTLASEIKIYNFEKNTDLEITRAEYDQYTLMAGNDLQINAQIKNDGLNAISQYTIFAYYGEELLSKQEVNNLLLPGRFNDVKLSIPLPTDIDFNKIKLYVSENDNDVDLSTDGFLLELYLKDISVENTLIIFDEFGANITASIVNRGILNTESTTVYLREESENGAIINSCVINGLSNGEEKMVSFDLTNIVQENKVYYITVDQLTDETFIANNNDFSFMEKHEENKIVIELPYDYDYIEKDSIKTVTLDENNSEQNFIFIPEKTGFYKFYSMSEDDPYGSIFDERMEQIAFDDDKGDEYNFAIKCKLEAGKPYILNVGCYSDNVVFDICIEETIYCTGIELISEPNRKEYIEGYALEVLNVSGMALQYTWSDGTKTNWDVNLYSENVPGGYDFSLVNEDGALKFFCDDQTYVYYLTLLENPVDHLELISGTSKTLFENYNGYIDENADGEEYFHYNINAWDIRDAVIKIVYKDGSFKTANSESIVDGYSVNWSEDQNNSPWVVGTENKSTVSYLGCSVNLPITVIENPVDHLELVSGTSKKYIENYDGWVNTDEDDNEYFDYYTNHFDTYDAVIKIVYKNGNFVTANVGDTINNEYISWSEDQYNSHWVLGTENKSTISYLGHSVNLPITVIENPVDYIVVNTAPTREYVYGDTQYGSIYFNGDFYFSPNDLTGLTFTVYYKDGTNKFITWEDLGSEMMLDGYSVNITSEIETAAAENIPITLEYLGKSAEYTVVLKESPVSSIVVTKQPNITEYSEYYSPDLVGTEVTITYTNGTSKVVALTEENIKYKFYWYDDISYVVDVDGYELNIYQSGETFVFAYLGQIYELNNIVFTEKKEIKKVDFENISLTGENMIVKVTYEDETVDEILFEDVVCSAGTYFSRVLAVTKNGILFCEIYDLGYNETTNKHSYEFYIFDKSISVEYEEEIDTPTYQLGDVDGKNGINNSDLIMLRRYLAGWGVTINEDAANLDGRGGVNNSDAIWLARHLAGWAGYELD